jgi:hypothetical protein
MTLGHHCQILFYKNRGECSKGTVMNVTVGALAFTL